MELLGLCLLLSRSLCHNIRCRYRKADEHQRINKFFHRYNSFFVKLQKSVSIEFNTLSPLRNHQLYNKLEFTYQVEP